MIKEKRDIRIVFLVFSALFTIVSWKQYPSILSYILMLLVLFILSMIAFSPFTLRPIFKLWLKFAHVLGKINTQILLTLMFILIFIPIGLVIRLFGNDPMKRKMQVEGTYWEFYKLEGLKDKSRYEKQF